jgi:hypothetical protein
MDINSAASDLFCALDEGSRYPVVIILDSRARRD